MTYQRRRDEETIRFDGGELTPNADNDGAGPYMHITLDGFDFVEMLHAGYIGTRETAAEAVHAAVWQIRSARDYKDSPVRVAFVEVYAALEVAVVKGARRLWQCFNDGGAVTSTERHLYGKVGAAWIAAYGRGFDAAISDVRLWQEAVEEYRDGAAEVGDDVRLPVAARDYLEALQSLREAVRALHLLDNVAKPHLLYTAELDHANELHDELPDGVRLAAPCIMLEFWSGGPDCLDAVGELHLLVDRFNADHGTTFDLHY